MINIWTVSSPAEKKNLSDDILRNFDPQKSTYVVSDLSSKYEIQKFLIAKFGSYEDHSVLRASELWKILFQRAHPEFKIVGSDYIKVLIKDHLAKNHAHLSPQSYVTVEQFMDQMIPLFSHDDGVQRMRQWLGENPKSLSRWGGWFMVAQECYQAIIKKKIVSNKWLSGFLSNSLFFERFWDRHLIFDLGFHINKVEAELIQLLSKSNSTEIFIPEPSWGDRYKYLLEGYRIIKDASGKKNKAPFVEQKNVHVFKKLSSQLAEIKEAVTQVRQWVSDGVPANQIVIAAPQIENYWAELKIHFKEEGFLVNKDTVAKLQSFPDIMQWMARLKSINQNLNFADLESSVFYNQEEPSLKFEVFKSHFLNLIDNEDLKRNQDMEEAYGSQQVPKGPVSLDFFIGFALKFWPSFSSEDHLEAVVRELLAQSSIGESLNIEDWIFYLQQLVAKKEIKVEEGARTGVQFVNVSALNILSYQKIIFVGLSNEQYRKRMNFLLSTNEINSISQNLGFFIDHPELSVNDCDLFWFAENKSSHFYYPATNFMGDPEAANEFWLSQSAQSLEAPLSGRNYFSPVNGEQDLESYLSSEHKKEFSSAKKTTIRILQDLGLKDLPKIETKLSFTLSPSSLERFRSCGFVFLAEKAFHLLDLPLLDLDLDRRREGQLMHALLQRLTQEPFNETWSQSQIEEVLEDLKKEMGLNLNDSFWIGTKKKYLALAQRFLQFEKEWRAQFPQTKTVGREKSFKFVIDPLAQKLHPQDFPTGVAFSGVIDRIDQDQSGNAVVIDYKTSASQKYTSFGSWIKGNQLQLLFYALSLDNNFVEGLEDLKVVGACYFVLKNLNRNLGFKIEEKAGTLYGLDHRRNKLSEEKKAELYEEFKSVIFENVQKILENEFKPLPIKETQCTTCQWNELCRVPHLN